MGGTQFISASLVAMHTKPIKQSKKSMRGKTVPISSQLAVFFTRLFGAINIHSVLKAISHSRLFFFSFFSFKRSRIFSLRLLHRTLSPLHRRYLQAMYFIFPYA